MSLLPESHARDRSLEKDRTGRNIGTALPQRRVIGGTGTETSTEPGRFARGAVIGLAIMVPFWVAVAAILLWVL